MKLYHNPSDVEVIQNRNTKKIIITDLYGNQLIKFCYAYGTFPHRELLKLIPCRTELRFNKLYDYAFLHQVL